MEILKTLRKSRNLTLEQEAEELKTSSQVLSRYERGDREPDCEMLKSLAKFYNVSIDFLLTGKEIFKNNNAVLTAFESDVVGELRRLSKTDKQNLARIIFSYTQNYALVEKYKTQTSAYETAVSD